MDFDFLNLHFEVIKKGRSSVVSRICTHSQSVQKGDLFVALKGCRQDGHQFLKSAAQKGAGFLLVENLSPAPRDFEGTLLKTKSTRTALPLLLNHYYNFPSEKLFTVGVTGTNGKTTVSYLIEHIFKTCGWKTGVIGTIDHHLDQKVWSSRLTTPEPVELFKRLSDFLNQSARASIMEISSIGLDQKRVEGVRFNIGIFTNLTPDHRDYHQTIENYFEAKARFFLSLLPSHKDHLALINRDDIYGTRLLSQLQPPYKTYGQSSADVTFALKKQEGLQTSFLLHTEQGSKEVRLPLIGIHNVYNAVAGITCALSTGFPFLEVIQAVESFKGVPGRLEKCTSNQHPYQVFVDYAHTPLALKGVLQALRTLKPRCLITVFGCGGERDLEKRPEMTRLASEFSDKVILTSDNPRNEDPSKIIEDCLRQEASHSSHLMVEQDRKKAIHKALEMGQKGDVILIAGKGHESYQLIQGKKHPFKDQEIVREWISS